MSSTSVTALRRTISKLQADRKVHEQAIKEIDAVFAQFGIIGKTAKARKAATKRKAKAKPRSKTVRKKRSPGRPKKKAKKPAKRKSKRATTGKRYKVPGPKMLLATIKAKGKSGATSADVVKAWKREGRKGNAHTILAQLIKAKKVKRQGIKGKKIGSIFKAA